MLRPVSLPVGCNKDRKSFLEEWTYLLFNYLFVYFGESVKYAYWAKIFSTVRIGSPLSRGVTAAFFARSGNVLLRMLMFMAFASGTDSSLATKWTSLGGILSSPVDFLSFIARKSRRTSSVETS